MTGWLAAADLGIRLDLLDLLDTAAGLTRCHITTLADVDPDFAYAAGTHALQILLTFEQEASPPERMVHPRPAELMDEHTEAQIGDRNTLEHNDEPHETKLADAQDTRGLCRAH